MRKSMILAVVLFLAAAFNASAAFADGVSTLTLTPSGTQTNFTITGVYTAGTATTAFSAPGAAYTLTFSVPSSPTSLVSVIPGPDGQFGVDISLDLNGTTFGTSEVEFFQSSIGGGLGICVGEVCPSDGSLSPIFWSIFQPSGQLFTSSAADGVSNPTFLSGSITIDTSASGYQIIVPGAPTPTPEPSSFLLLGTGLVGLIGWGKRKLAA
ncbi:MAG TPA: PEP-CTERM sorting domain-containing protein [Candidatus Acidoferrales bacterium]|nr:PEP-CTERM sorting domain-containing protein [Candidatus Acidoferrales bacterium]